jgi:hypothetical protein
MKIEMNRELQTSHKKVDSVAWALRGDARKNESRCEPAGRSIKTVIA